MLGMWFKKSEAADPYDQYREAFAGKPGVEKMIAAIKEVTKVAAEASNAVTHVCFSDNKEWLALYFTEAPKKGLFGRPRKYSGNVRPIMSMHPQLRCVVGHARPAVDGEVTLQLEKRLPGNRPGKPTVSVIIGNCRYTGNNLVSKIVEHEPETGKQISAEEVFGIWSLFRRCRDYKEPVAERPLESGVLISQQPALSQT